MPSKKNWKNLKKANKMAQGFALNIGLNSIDRTKYKGRYQTLRNAENDADFYYEMAIKNHFIATKLIGKNATSGNLLDGLKTLSDKMVAGDTLFLSYSGHGSRVKDLNGDEDDGYDEALVLYDRLFIDDEFQLCWARFKAGVRIFFTNDSCYNGTVSRLLLNERGENIDKTSNPKYVLRGIDTNEAMIDFANNLGYFKGIKLKTDPNAIKAVCSIIHIGSCLDNQLSDDGLPTQKNGKFTLAVRKLYDEGHFKVSYRLFYELLKVEMPPWQTPSWDTEAGKTDDAFIESTFLQI
ncbi:caspase family protein [Pedobacter sp. UC225_65]|uniref:caspase family protein n=1 Tax=Pedobacter sp. UC225_65 TaxID=3350173 RepID=UPI003671DE25